MVSFIIFTIVHGSLEADVNQVLDCSWLSSRLAYWCKSSKDGKIGSFYQWYTRSYPSSRQVSVRLTPDSGVQHAREAARCAKKELLLMHQNIPSRRDQLPVCPQEIEEQETDPCVDQGGDEKS